MAKLFDALNAATQADLDEIVSQINEHESALSSLRTLERVLRRRFKGPAERKPREPKAENPGDTLEAKRRKVALYLMANGAKSKASISTACKIGTVGRGNVTEVTNCSWFHVNPEGVVTITSIGENANPLGRQ